MHIPCPAPRGVPVMSNPPCSAPSASAHFTMLHSASRLTYHWRCILLHGSGGIGATLVILPFHPFCCSFCSVCFVSYYCVFSCAGPVQRSAERWICPRCLILWAKTGSTSSTFLLHRTNWLNWLDEDCHHFQCSDFLQSTGSSVFLHAIPNNSWNYRFAPEIVQRFRSFCKPGNPLKPALTRKFRRGFPIQ